MNEVSGMFTDELRKLSSGLRDVISEIVSELETKGNISPLFRKFRSLGVIVFELRVLFKTLKNSNLYQRLFIII